MDPYAAAFGIPSPFLIPPFSPATQAQMLAGGLSALGMGGSSMGGDDIRTIFITGFPEDVRDRELHNLLRFLPGYEACQVRQPAAQQEHPLPRPVCSALLPCTGP